MAIEYEVKLRGERDALLAALAGVGGRPCGPRTLEDDYVLDTAERRILASGGLLRLRRRDDGFLLTLKGRSDAHGEVKAMTEVETGVDDGETALMLLEQLGYAVAMRYQKYRTPFACARQQCGGLVVTLDETPLGCFIELEGDPDAIHRCAAALGFARADYETRSYLEIHRAESDARDMLFAEAAPAGDGPAVTGSRAAS